jgi:hypothetical protein
MKKFRETNTFLNKEKKGRQSKLTELQLTAWVEEDRRSTSFKLSRMAKEAFGVDVTELLWEEVDRRIKLKKRGGGKNKFACFRRNCKRMMARF